jgi:hypothetical protein
MAFVGCDGTFISCDKSCHIACDLLMSQIMPTCPAGQKCGPGEGLFESAILAFFQSVMGGSNATVCYPE